MCAHPPVYKWGWGHTLHFYLDKYTVKIHFGNRYYDMELSFQFNFIFTVPVTTGSVLHVMKGTL